ncbi:hypothetical protein IFT67_01470 [Sphingomonas sp. CFBP 13728]|uniref:DUF2946 family protein n=1 Tax=Sphingomonas sp. CFBP 13728 TaxID=2775294 RepID=UPI00177E0D07|nr:DUF2946 family protein [Sphingomonas sp. CFBP 13728]MBD8617586.1 hypothetical protein [Sphingomonas sp. CFBP 13728]
MAGFRRLFLDHGTLSAWLIVCALAMKILVPAGFMPVVSGGTVTIQICGGTAPTTMVTMIAKATMMAKTMPGMMHHQDKGDHQSREMPCAFSGLSAPSLAAVDPLLLAIAIAFIVAMGFRRTSTTPVAAPAYLRPPLRGPPRVSA